MKLLAIETTASVASVALMIDGKIVCSQRADSGRKHAETILPLIEHVLRLNNILPTDIDYFAVDVGPGSFTGVRIGVTVANALAFAAGKKIIPVNALETLCAPFSDIDRPILALIDARNQNAYAGSYSGKREVLSPRADRIDILLENMSQNTVVVGDVQDDRFEVAEEYRLPNAAWVASVASENLERACDSSTPLYLRPSQAERLRDERRQG